MALYISPSEESAREKCSVDSLESYAASLSLADL
ncbi:hypothetical protein COLO4_28393 [Corchorus olitorius]|uniref:Uncharacterized protein n=1 Tax=Corchorus olitorius TaxID=93759 RepID=A0A1R3HL72_9ROSI|nr:hypothetical protein COLO4_28393 [Corchorus olitorius]